MLHSAEADSASAEPRSVWQSARLGTLLFASLALLAIGTPFTFWPQRPWLNLPCYDSLVAFILGPLLLASILWPKLSLPKLRGRDWVLVGFLGWVALSALTKGNWRAAEPFINLGLLSLFLSHANLTGKQTKTLVVILVGAGSLVAAHGIYQWLFLAQIPVSSALLQQNNYSGYLCLLLPLSLCLWTSASKALNYLGAVFTTILALGMALSLTRAGYIAAIAGMAIFALVKDRRLLLVVLAYLVCFGLTIEEVRTRFIQINIVPEVATRLYRSGGHQVGYIEGDTVTCRYFLWRFAWQEFKTAPATGIGIGNYRSHLAKYLEENPVIRQTVPAILEPHNSFIKVLCELGVPGLLLFLGVLATWFLACASRLLSFNRHRIDPWAFALLCGLGTFMIHNLTNTLFILVPCALVFWIAMGLLTQVTQPKVAESRL